MNYIIYLLSIFGLAFCIKEKDGPFGLISKFRNLLMRNRYIGTFFYNLLECYFCLGFWCGIIIYLLSQDNYYWNFAILWGLSGAVLCLFFNVIFLKLN